MKKCVVDLNNCGKSDGGGGEQTEIIIELPHVPSCGKTGEAKSPFLLRTWMPTYWPVLSMFPALSQKKLSLRKGSNVAWCMLRKEKHGIAY